VGTRSQKAAALEVEGGKGGGENQKEPMKFERGKGDEKGAREKRLVGA